VSILDSLVATAEAKAFAEIFAFLLV
jgi:hypothetical protein